MKTKIILALSAAAVVGLTAAPAAAHERDHRGWNRNQAAMGCAKWKHGRCVRRGNAYAYGQNRGNGDYRVGYRFGPSYAYTPYNQIPGPYVSQYNLRPDGRYVYRDNRVYVVNPNTYAVERVLDAISR